MPQLDWTLLDAFQAGALFALAAAYGADALGRRDRLMGWMAVGCLLLGLRHSVVCLGGHGSDPLGFAGRMQILLSALGFIALCAALVHLFPRAMPRRFPRWIALGLLPDLARVALRPLAHPVDAALGYAADLTYLVGCGIMIQAALRARMLGDPMGTRFFYGFLAASFPVVVEVAASTLFGMRLHLTGLSMMMLAIAIGSAWQWLATQSLRDQIQETEDEAEAWRALMPGATFRTDRPSAFLETAFGPGWADLLRRDGVNRVVALNGTSYRLATHPLPRRHLMGWLARDEDTRPGLGGFLAGWTVALGMDASSEASRIEGWLRTWGADIEIWSTVPPREGPYPSVLVWAREPSILAVWREDDLLRRRARWIQIGGPRTEGPHVRLAPPATESDLRGALEQLLGPAREH